MDNLYEYQFLQPAVGFQNAIGKSVTVARDNRALVYPFWTSLASLYNLMLADVDSDVGLNLSQQSREELVRTRERAKDVAVRYRQALIENENIVPVPSELHWHSFVEGNFNIPFEWDPENYHKFLYPWLLKLAPDANFDRMRLSIVTGVGAIFGIVVHFLYCRHWFCSQYKWELAFIAEILICWSMYEIFAYTMARRMGIL